MGDNRLTLDGNWPENLPDGESLTRQILCAKKYLGELFGLPPGLFLH